MTYCVEPFIQDLVWCWLDQHAEYTEVAGEVGIGSGVNAGRIDLVAKTSGGEFHGFEIKNNAFADEQLNRYLRAGYLDRLYHCSRVGAEFAERLSDGPDFKTGTYTNQQIRKQVSNGIAAGQYTEAEYKQVLRETFPEEILDQQAGIASQVNQRVLDESEKTVWARLTRNIGIPTADFDPSETYISLDEAMARMRNNQAVPTEIGLIDVPFSYDLSEEQDGFRRQLDESVAEMFAKDKRDEVTVIREPERLTRDQSPTLSRTNEAWVQHYVWVTGGTIREAVIPHVEDDAEYLIDIMGFEGGSTPTEVYRDGEDAKLIGIEAKGEAAFGGREDRVSIREQLLKYRGSGVLTHLYLAVPKQNREEGEAVLADPRLSGVGLLTVSRNGGVETEIAAERMSMQYDGYIKKSGSHEYPRSIGFGTVAPNDELEFVSPCQIRG